MIEVSLSHFRQLTSLSLTLMRLFATFSFELPEAYLAHHLLGFHSASHHQSLSFIGVFVLLLT